MNKQFETYPNIAETGTKETIAELVRRHIMDKNHTTTDEELRNAQIEFSDIVSLNTKDLYNKNS
jgi:G3E family GTPase